MLWSMQRSRLAGRCLYGRRPPSEAARWRANSFCLPSSFGFMLQWLHISEPELINRIRSSGRRPCLATKGKLIPTRSCMVFVVPHAGKLTLHVGAPSQAQTALGAAEPETQPTPPHFHFSGLYPLCCLKNSRLPGYSHADVDGKGSTTQVPGNCPSRLLLLRLLTG